MRKAVVTLAAAVALALGALTLSRRRSAEVTPVTQPTPRSPINLHASPEPRLKVCGRTFARLRGGPPYFIAATNTPVILLSYENAAGGKMLVAVDTNRCSIREIPLTDSAFGQGIGDWEATRGEFGDVVESVSSNKIFILTKGFKYLERSVLDLKAGTFRVKEVQSEMRRLNLEGWTAANERRQA